MSAPPAQRNSGRVHQIDGTEVEVPVIGHLHLPRPEHLAYYGGLAALAAFSLIDWPIAIVLAAGDVLAENARTRVTRRLGEALDEA
jgi:hypothetical protein